MSSCARCGATIETLGQGRRRPRSHCAACRREIVRLSTEPPAAECIVCAGPLSGRRRHQVTCSPACRSSLHRMRRDTSE